MELVAPVTYVDGVLRVGGVVVGRIYKEDSGIWTIILPDLTVKSLEWMSKDRAYQGLLDYFGVREIREMEDRDRELAWYKRQFPKDSKWISAGWCTTITGNAVLSIPADEPRWNIAISRDTDEEKSMHEGAFDVVTVE